MFYSTINSVSVTLFKEVHLLCLRFCVDSRADRHIINHWLSVCQLRLPLRPKQRLSLETAQQWLEIKWQRTRKATQNVALVRFNNLIKNVKYDDALSFTFVLSPERLKSMPRLFYRDIKTTKRRTFRDPRTNV